MRRLMVWMGTGFGLGYSPWASGTVGSLLGIPLAYAIYPLHWGYQTPIAAALALVSVPICTIAEIDLGGEKDNGKIVADEYLTFPISLIGVPWMQSAGNLWMLGMAFVVFRIMDIIKPFPAYRLQSLRGGWGITIDDAIAALYALALNHIVLCFMR